MYEYLTIYEKFYEFFTEGQETQITKEEFQQLEQDIRQNERRRIQLQWNNHTLKQENIQNN